MEITEVRIKLMEASEDRLRGFCSVTFDSCFVVRDLKIIDGNSGPFVAMPSRKLTSNCGKCRTKNHMRANYCNQCGQKLRQIKPQQGADGRAKLYADIAHPINARCREMIQKRVIEELKKEQELARQPGYRSRYDESYDAGPDVRSDEFVDQPKRSDSEKAERTDKAHSDGNRPPNSTKSRPEQSEANGSSSNPDISPASGDDFGQGIFD
jgi:stage V sporulation protein G